MVRTKKIDATQGAFIPLIISFVLPLILMTLIQKLFNAVDIAVLGKMADTTAVAVAWGINADVCEIYSDVDGVYSADPRICPRARKRHAETAAQNAACTGNNRNLSGQVGIENILFDHFRFPSCIFSQASNRPLI